jgi:GNAT superfamily N-acetyltransferase
VRDRDATQPDVCGFVVDRTERAVLMKDGNNISMQVRPIRREELSGLLRLYENFRRQDEPPLSCEGTNEQEVWSEICANPGLRYYAVEVDGAMVSTCTLTLIPNLLHAQRRYGLIENVVTDPCHRKRGYATAVLHYALDEAWREGCYKVMLLTGSKLEETLRFYENAGFKRGVKTGFIAFPPDNSN